jgi:uncharacterized protein (TIGR02246 family)
MANLEDELALRNLMARYVDAVNRYDADAWIATWAEDGVWNLLGNPVEGREAILGLWQQMMATFEYALLFPSSCLFEIDGDSASGHWYIHEYSRDLEGNSGVILSRYVDTYVKRDGEWLFKTRDYGFIYNGPSDFSGDFTRPE